LLNRQQKLPMSVQVRTLTVLVSDESRDVVRFAEHRQEVG
jgi:hypothetical protein